MDPELALGFAIVVEELVGRGWVDDSPVWKAVRVAVEGSDLEVGRQVCLDDLANVGRHLCQHSRHPIGVANQLPVGVLLESRQV